MLPKVQGKLESLIVESNRTIWKPKNLLNKFYDITGQSWCGTQSVCPELSRNNLRTNIFVIKIRAIALSLESS